MYSVCFRQQLFNGTFSNLSVNVRNHFILVCIVNGIVALVFRLISIALTSASFIITEPMLGEMRNRVVCWDVRLYVFTYVTKLCISGPANTTMLWPLLQGHKKYYCGIELTKFILVPH